MPRIKEDVKRNLLSDVDLPPVKKEVETEEDKVYL